MAKILVVDDEVDFESLIRQRFRKKIRKKEHEFLFALNGQEALDKIKEHQDIDIVLSDINMPVMDGLTLLSRIKEQNVLLKSVVVSAYGDMENIRTAMNRGAFDFVTKPVDFQDLDHTINRTADRVAELRQTVKTVKENDIMKLYVDETALNFMSGQELESSLTRNELIQGTVAFIDICKFTAISESVTPDNLVSLLNTYFDVMVEQIIHHDGHIDKFIGDAIMAVFRKGDHLLNAAKCALAVRSKVEELPDKFMGIDFKPKLSIGINTGEMISGNIGSPALKRLDYTVLGDVVNTAQRIQSAADEDQIVIPEWAKDQLQNQFKCTELRVVSLKNKATPVKIFALDSAT